MKEFNFSLSNSFILLLPLPLPRDRRIFRPADDKFDRSIAPFKHRTNCKLGTNYTPYGTSYPYPLH